MQATISGQPATQSLSSIRRQPARRQIRTAVGISGATVGRAISGRTGRRCGPLKAWWIGFSAQAGEGAQGPLTTRARRANQRRGRLAPPLSSEVVDLLEGNPGRGFQIWAPYELRPFYFGGAGTSPQSPA